MPSRYTQYGGAQGAEMALREMVAQRIAAEMEARKQAVETYKLGQADRQIDQGDARIGLDMDRLAENTRQFDAGAPQRDAQTGYLRTQTADLANRPIREADSRAHDAMMQQTKQADTLAQIKAQGDKEARVAGIRTSTQKSTADELAEFEAKEQIKAKYGGSRPSLGAERQTLAYFNRAKQASEDIGNMEEGIAKMGLGGQARLQYAPNILQSDENQRYRQAQRAFTEARLRKESGAAIPQGEYENDARTYFAQPGDGPDVIAQKRQARQVVLEGLKFGAGKAYDEFYGAQPQQQPSGGVSIKSIRQVR
jgi:hypothetical protein